MVKKFSPYRESGFQIGAQGQKEKLSPEEKEYFDKIKCIKKQEVKSSIDLLSRISKKLEKIHHSIEHLWALKANQIWSNCYETNSRIYDLKYSKNEISYLVLSQGLNEFFFQSKIENRFVKVFTFSIPNYQTILPQELRFRWLNKLEDEFEIFVSQFYLEVYNKIYPKKDQSEEYLLTTDNYICGVLFGFCSLELENNLEIKVEITLGMIE